MVYTTVEDGWVQAQLAEVPGVLTVAPSREEAAEHLLDAMQEYLLALQQAEPPVAVDPTTERESVEVAITLKSA